MTVIFCVDERGGLLFNNRRQSMDSILRERVLKIIGDAKLTCDEYTAKQFEDKSKLNIVTDENYSDFEFVFAEKQNPILLLEKADKIYLYNWNRKYPFDKSLGELPKEFKLISSEDFVGSSHEKITEKIYSK
jgi:hypothetical protein